MTGDHFRVAVRGKCVRANQGEEEADGSQAKQRAKPRKPREGQRRTGAVNGEVIELHLVVWCKLSACDVAHRCRQESLHHNYASISPPTASAISECSETSATGLAGPRR